MRERLPEDVVEAFDNLANEQRGAPEAAMTKAQFAHGGGVYSYIIEHVGDLTHRMAKKEHIRPSGGGRNIGKDYVENKATKTLKTLNNPYSFEREHQENAINNARCLDMPLVDYKERLTKALQKYADEHRKLPVYNKAQFAAREAAVALGEQRIRDAKKYLQYLVDISRSQAKYDEASLAYERNPDGTLVTL